MKLLLLQFCVIVDTSNFTCIRFELGLRVLMVLSSRCDIHIGYLQLVKLKIY
jgi:hypothetical protein